MIISITLCTFHLGPKETKHSPKASIKFSNNPEGLEKGPVGHDTATANAHHE